ncbi:hypothetical protein PM076_13420 [Halorubrum ezzemoulense]|uniref:Uncharacterized protein n=2 Tax=Halorubrum ezzemoulense TaxID=337243 RepID=A0A1X4H3D1_HALEZ|nr:MULTISPECIES: hypothetical protein [Halorubrum]MDB2224445.1 hypothetical protein [Halorubrum ezzemoulense]MDB2242873.1 hypothetical protein [Halorubrum ezzemoulense]MDB2245748.1 hypothetical protein [Halorubrum ezzemoulense]MDB2252979.1 hypothetical protein [Halorubrum ezzemoulense]MDB2279395.1 hypothetical protein [Halorubrum ezzemoulense]
MLTRIRWGFGDGRFRVWHRVGLVDILDAGVGFCDLVAGEAPLGFVAVLGVVDVETANQLRASLSRTEDLTDERDRRQAAREWDHLETRRRLVEDVLRLHDRFPGERRSASA